MDGFRLESGQQADGRVVTFDSRVYGQVKAGEGRPHITLCGRNSVQIHERHRPVDFAEMTDRLRPHGTVRHNAKAVYQFYFGWYDANIPDEFDPDKKRGG